MIRYLIALIIGMVKIVIIGSILIIICLLLTFALDHIPYLGVFIFIIVLIGIILAAVATGMDTLNRWEKKDE